MPEATFPSVIEIMSKIGFEYFLVPLFIFAVLFAILEKSKAISEKTDINAIIAIVVAFVIAMTPGLSQFLFSLIPYFIILLVIIFFIALFFMFLGVESETIVAAAKHPVGYVFLMVISFLLIIQAWSMLFGEQFYNLTKKPPENLTSSEQVVVILTSPTVTAMIVFFVLLAIATLAIVYKPKT
jgi:hypothetical protein